MIDGAASPDFRQDAMERLKTRLPRFREEIENIDGDDCSLSAGVEALLAIHDKCGPSGIRDLLLRDIHPTIGFFSQSIQAKPLSEDPAADEKLKAILGSVAKDINADLALFRSPENVSDKLKERREMLREMFYMLTGGTIASGASLPTKKELNQREYRHDRWHYERDDKPRMLRRHAQSIMNMLLGCYAGHRAYSISTGKLSPQAAFLKAPLVEADSYYHRMDADEVLQSASQTLERYLYPEKNRCGFKAR